MPHKDFNLLEELENISNIPLLEDADIDQVMLDFSKGILPTLGIERINFWLFNANQTILVSIGEYDSRTGEFKKNSILKRSDFPVYFDGLILNKLIHAENIYEHPLTMEFNQIYSKPNNIFSLLDIPLRVSGKLVGVICFEKTGSYKKFSLNEQSFCLSISYVLSSILETRHRLVLQTKLETALKEKEILISELNHRVKNNFSILISLLRLSKNKAESNEAKDVLVEYEQRVFAMSKIYDLLNSNHYLNAINVSVYLKELINEFHVSYPQFNHCINSLVDHSEQVMPSNKVINLGLIVSEIILNSIKYASDSTSNYSLLFHYYKLSNNKMMLKIGDNGPGFDFEKGSKSSSLGLSLIKDLSESLDASVTFPKIGNAYYEFVFSV